jgi:aminocarboxymuconate-semialdehyde decarboxylase
MSLLENKLFSSISVIDLHAHILLKGAFDRVRNKYPRLVPTIELEPGDKCAIIMQDPRFLPAKESAPRTIFDVEKRIADMRRMNIHVQALSVIPSLLYYTVEPDVGLALAKAQNDALANIVETYPDSFVGLANVPLQDARMAADELERAVLELGLKGTQIGSNINGLNLDDPSLEPFYAKAEHLNALIAVHPHNISARERLTQYALVNFIGIPLETTIAIASIIFGGVLERHPTLKFFFVHGGGYVPYQRGRWEHGFQRRDEPKKNISKPPSQYLRVLTFDTVTHYAPALKYLISTIGSDHVALGSDYPFDMADHDPVKTITTLNLSKEDEEKILGGNARRLLNL